MRRGRHHGRIASSGRLRALLCALSCALPVTAPALAQTDPSRAAPAPAETATGPRFDVTGYRLEGNTLLDTAALDPVLAAHTGPGRTFADVQAAAQAVRAAHAAAGYASVRVDIPEQRLAGGVVRLVVVEPRLRTLRVDGARHADDTAVLRALPSLRIGTTPNTQRLAREIRLANENPSRQVTVELQGDTATDAAVDARVQVRDERPWRIGATLDDTGSDSTGRARAGIFLQHADVAGLGHVTTAQYVTSPGHVSQVTIAAVNHRAPLPALGDALDLYAVHADVDSGVVAEVFDVRGRGDILGLRYTLNVASSGAWRQRWLFGLEQRKVDNRVGFAGGAPELVPDVTLHPASIGHAASWSDADRRVETSLAYHRNLPGGRRGDAAAFEAARAGAPADYGLWRYAASLAHELPQGWQLRLAVEGQHTRDPLVSGEQFGLGGRDSVRGFDERAVTGDRGLRGSVEVHTPDLGARLDAGVSARALFFVDQGSAWRNAALPGETRRVNVGSIGLGLRVAWAPSWHLRLDAAHVLQGGGVEVRGRERLHASLGWVL